jgi:integrase
VTQSWCSPAQTGPPCIRSGSQTGSGSTFGRPGYRRFRLHDVRHSYATAALAAGVPAKMVGERLGHANIAITMDTYSHVLPGLDEQAAGQVARLILGEGSGDAS